MLSLRAHHILCLVIPDSDDFRSKAKEMFRKKGYTSNYINAYMKVFEIARANENEEIKILNSPKGDDTCPHCSNYKEGTCTSPQAAIFTGWDEEILTIFGLSVGDTLKVRDLRKLVKEKVDPQNMPGVCKGCLFDLNRECGEILIRMREMKGCSRPS